MYVKGFKGKGDLVLWVGDSEREYQSLVADMEWLSELSRSISGHVFFLQVHRRRTVEKEMDVSLRWRGRNQVENKHLNWADVQKAISGMPQEVQNNYFEMQAAATYFNLRVRTSRYSVKLARDAVDAVTMSTDPVYKRTAATV